MNNHKQKIESFVNRLKKIGIDVELFGNYPWIYIHSINGNLVREKHFSEHGFTIGLIPSRKDHVFEFMDIGLIFILIRKYVTK